MVINVNTNFTVAGRQANFYVSMNPGIKKIIKIYYFRVKSFFFVQLITADGSSPKLCVN